MNSCANCVKNWNAMTTDAAQKEPEKSPLRFVRLASGAVPG